MIIGVDIDEILAEFYKDFLDWMKREQGISVSYDQLYTYRLCNILGESQEQSLTRLHEFLHKHARDIQVVLGSQQGIQALAQNHDLYAITSRDRFSEDDTRWWLNKHFEGCFEDVYFANHKDAGFHVSKSHFIKQLNVDVMIEDYEAYALDVASTGIPVLMLKKPWNDKEHHNGVFVIDSWEQIPRFVDDLALRHTFSPGEYQHYNGTVYVAERLVRDEETLESRVIYRSQDQKMWWSMPIHQFFSQKKGKQHFTVYK